MSLGDYAGEGGGRYLKQGWHTVRISEIREWTAHTGTSGIDCELEHPASSRIQKVSFTLDTEPALRRLASFAQACGLTKQELAAYDEKSMQSHRTLINRRVQVLIEKEPGAKYAEVVDWNPVGIDAPVVATPAVFPPTEEPLGPTEADIPF